MTEPFIPTLTTLRWVPDFAIGHVRDVRIRWALEELERPYRLRLIGPEEQASPAYRQQQPFGQVPVYQDADSTLFESASILYHLGQQSPLLMPEDAEGRRQTLSWLFAAANSVEPAVGALAELKFFADAAWVAERRPSAEQHVQRKLEGLAQWLQDREYLTGRFTVADIMMASTLKMADDAVLARFPAVQAYYRRCAARPACVKALADQIALYSAATPD
jgi:glutathione S-transferase